MSPRLRYQACSSKDTLTKGCLLQLLEEGTAIKTFFGKLDDDQWFIVSFDRETRDVCIKVTAPTGERYLSVTLPNLPS